jgi:hypothetical protein
MSEKKNALEAAEAKYNKLYAQYQALREEVVEAKKARDAALVAEQEEAAADTPDAPERVDGVAELK